MSAFQRPDLPADRRLAEAQRLAGMGERSGVGGRLKNPQFVPIHVASPRDAGFAADRRGVDCRLFRRLFLSCRAGSCAASQRSASSAAMQPSPAAVTA